jgi:hypothetical protein
VSGRSFLSGETGMEFRFRTTYWDSRAFIRDGFGKACRREEFDGAFVLCYKLLLGKGLVNGDI